MPSPVDMVLTMAKQLVNRPDDVQARWVEGADGPPYVELKVSAEDRGRVIGRRGKTIDALRSLATSVFADEGGQIDIKLLEE